MNTRFITNCVYQIKKDFGKTIRYIQIEQAPLDASKGTRAYVRTFFDIDCAILPQDLMRKFVQDISYLAANKNFTYGGLNDYNTMSFIFDVMPKEFDNSLNGYLIYNNERYEKMSLESIADGVCFLLKAKHVQGDLPYSILTAELKQQLKFVGSVSNVLN